MTYLLDTDILSNLLRPVPSGVLVAKLATVPIGQQNMSSITLGELYYGAHRLGDRATRLRRRLEELATERPILSFDADAARQYGELRAQLEQQGTPIGDADTRIASIALTRGLIMVTRNVRHFGRVPGLMVENWIA